MLKTNVSPTFDTIQAALPKTARKICIFIALTVGVVLFITMTSAHKNYFANFTELILNLTPKIWSYFCLGILIAISLGVHLEILQS